MNDYLANEIHANQGNSGEAFVAALLGRRGFTVNPSLQDRWGWDFYIEHVTPPGKIGTRKFEGLVQVKSTRVHSKSTVQIKLSALLRLIQSNSVAVISFVRFNRGSDVPISVSFAHVGKAVIRSANEAALKASEDKIETHDMWVSIERDQWLEVPMADSANTDIYSHFVKYSEEFGDNYAVGKSKFYHSLNPIAKGDILPKEMVIGDAYLKFTHPRFSPVVHRTTAYMACIGPRFYYRLRSPFCEIEVNGNHVHSRFSLNPERPLSELDDVLSALDLMETHGWSLEISGAVQHVEPLLLSYDVRDDDMKPVAEIVRIYRQAFIECGLPDHVVHFFQVAGKLYGLPELFRLIKSGGAVRAPNDVSLATKSVFLDMLHVYESFSVVITWKFDLLHNDVVPRHTLFQVGPGSFFRAKAYHASEIVYRSRESLVIDYREDIFVKSSDNVVVPSVKEFRDPETIGIF